MRFLRGYQVSMARAGIDGRLCIYSLPLINQVSVPFVELKASRQAARFRTNEMNFFEASPLPNIGRHKTS